MLLGKEDIIYTKPSYPFFTPCRMKHFLNPNFQILLEIGIVTKILQKKTKLGESKESEIRGVISYLEIMRQKRFSAISCRKF